MRNQELARDMLAHLDSDESVLDWINRQSDKLRRADNLQRRTAERRARYSEARA